MKRRFFHALLAAALFFGAAAAEAVSSQSGGESHFTAEQIVSFSKRVEKELAARGVRVFIIARIGRPAEELPAGIRYTHTAIGIYSLMTTEDGRQVPGYAIYNLYQRENRPDTSELVQDFPVDFFAGVYELKAGIIIPTPALQRRLLEVVGSDTWRRLHNPHYSAIANPFDRRYQNCTEHTLDVINAAIYHTDDIRQIKANERAYFEAQKVEVSPVKMLLGAMFMPDITTADHRGGIRTATFTTIAGYLRKYHLMQEQFVITAN